MAEETPSSILYVQGGGSTITNGQNGSSMMTVKDIIPYYHVPMGNMSYLMPIQTLPGFSYPFNVAIILSGYEKESTSIVTVENLSLSDKNKTLTLQIKSLEFNEGSGLKTFASDGKDLTTDNGMEVQSTGLYLEIIEDAPKNGDSIEECVNQCTFKKTPWNICAKICERKLDPYTTN